MTADSRPDTHSRLPTTVLTEIQHTIKASAKAGFQAELDTMLHRIAEIAYAAGLAEAPRPSIAAPWADSLRAKLKEASKGETNTWGFVAMFMEMIGEVEKQAAPSATLTPAGWRYRYRAVEGCPAGVWRCVDREEECNTLPEYEREQVYSATMDGTTKEANRG
jgi:hypothetical protein